MNKSTLFKSAHTLTRKTIKTGDNYQVTFALCLKFIFTMFKTPDVLFAHSNEFFNAKGVYFDTQLFTQRGYMLLDENCEIHNALKDGKTVAYRNSKTTAMQLVVSEMENVYMDGCENSSKFKVKVFFSYTRIML